MKKWFISLAFITHSLAGFTQQKDIPYVILISFDGFRSDYVERFDLPNFKAFIKKGAASDGLIPSFPSKTFPNHYTLVTGLYPGNHGLVDNAFYDPNKKEQYGMRIKKAVTDPSYYGGTPLWTLARQHGLKSASYFWVGSELKEEGLHPDYYYEYNQSVPFEDRVDQVFTWLNLPETERPHLITLYFSSPDSESHRYGPLAEETQRKVIAMDSLLGDLMKRVRNTGLPVNVILVSDHGMSELRKKKETYIFLDDIVKTRKGSVIVVNAGTQAHLYTSSKNQRDSLYNYLKTKAKNFSILKREDFPQQWHYDHDRSGDILLLAKPGKYIITGDPQKFVNAIEYGSTFGVHGYDPDEVKDMYGIFYANGPNIKAGSRVQAFRNIHVYPLVAAILQLKTPEEIDGKISTLKTVYKE